MSETQEREELVNQLLGEASTLLWSLIPDFKDRTLLPSHEVIDSILDARQKILHRAEQLKEGAMN